MRHPFPYAHSTNPPSFSQLWPGPALPSPARPCPPPPCPALCLQFQPSEQLDAASFPFACKWVLSRLNGAVATTVKGMEAYELSQATWVS